MFDRSALRPSDWLVRIRPQPSLNSVSQGRTVLTTDLDGSIAPDSEYQGLWLYQTRMLSKYRWLIEGKPPSFAGNSHLQQHNWFGYYIAAIPNWNQTETHECNPTQQTLELRIYRAVGEGMHEEVELTNHTQIRTSFTLALEVDADFADPKETGKAKRIQHGRKQVKWKPTSSGGQLTYSYRARHVYYHQDAHGASHIDRRITLRLHAPTAARKVGRSLRFRVALEPHQSWRATLDWSAHIDGNDLPLNCGSLSAEQPNEWERKRAAFLESSTGFRTAPNRNLSKVVYGTL
jgi:hypothetical protein